jgi:hypothetical protein
MVRATAALFLLATLAFAQTISEQSDGQPTVASATATPTPVCEYVDGQPQNGASCSPTPTPVCEYVDGQPQNGASCAPTAPLVSTPLSPVSPPYTYPNGTITTPAPSGSGVVVPPPINATTLSTTYATSGSLSFSSLAITEASHTETVSRHYEEDMWFPSDMLLDPSTGQHGHARLCGGCSGDRSYDHRFGSGGATDWQCGCRSETHCSSRCRCDGLGRFGVACNGSL